MQQAISLKSRCNAWARESKYWFSYRARVIQVREMLYHFFSPLELVLLKWH